MEISQCIISEKILNISDFPQCYTFNENVFDECVYHYYVDKSDSSNISIGVKLHFKSDYFVNGYCYVILQPSILGNNAISNLIYLSNCVAKLFVNCQKKDVREIALYKSLSYNNKLLYNVLSGDLGSIQYTDIVVSFSDNVVRYLNNNINNILNITSEKESFDPKTTIYTIDDADIYTPNFLSFDAYLVYKYPKGYHNIPLHNVDKNAYISNIIITTIKDIVKESPKPIPYNEETYNMICSKICEMILKFTYIDTTFNNIYDSDDKLYKLVLEYFKNNQIDCTSSNIQKILGSTTTLTTSTPTTCGCSSKSSSSSISDSCYSNYKNAMNAYLKQMFGDINFYKHWFMYWNENWYTNLTLIDEILGILPTFDEANYYIVGDEDDSNYGCNCGNNTTSYCTANTIVSNFVYKILYPLVYDVKNGELKSYKNTFKIYGQEFGGILPKIGYKLITTKTNSYGTSSLYADLPNGYIPVVVADGDYDPYKEKYPNIYKWFSKKITPVVIDNN